jgi:glycosyltransferase involved in cell wall biosynthesis
MKLALVTDSVVAKSHGTGNLLLRLLAGTPLTATSFHLGVAKDPPALQSFGAVGRKTLAGWGQTLRRRLTTRTAPAGDCRRGMRYALDAEGRTRLQDADLVLAVVHTAEGLRFVHDMIATLPRPKPVILWFMDLLVTADDIGDARNSLPLLAGARIWAFNGRIKTSLELVFPERKDDIELRMFLGVPIPKHSHQVARELSSEMQCVMIGNVWDTSMMPVLDAVWTRACGLVQHDLALHWFGPPQAPASIAAAGAGLGGAIRYDGFAEDLDAVLRAADVAVVAFSRPDPNPSPFSRHSFPSRVADYAANGLPVFALCTDETALADYLNASGAGVYDTTQSIERAAAACAEFLRSTTRRQTCSEQARAFAETHFDLDQQRRLLVAELEASL